MVWGSSPRPGGQSKGKGMDARGSGKNGWRRPGWILPRRPQAPAKQGPGITARGWPRAVTAAPRAARGPFASRHLHPSPCAAAAERPHRARKKRILPGAEGLLSVRDGEERLLSGQRFHQRKGLAAQQRRHRGGAGRDGAPKARPLRCAALGPGSPGRTSERGAWLPGRWGRGGVRGRRELRLPSELAGPRHSHGSKGNASRGKTGEISPRSFRQLSPYADLRCGGRQSRLLSSGHGRKLLKNGGRFPSSPPAAGASAQTNLLPRGALGRMLG